MGRYAHSGTHVRHFGSGRTAYRCRRRRLWWPAMALHLHRAERTDLLADGLGALLADPLPDPFAEELVLVPARGVERWLSQRLSQSSQAPADRWPSRLAASPTSRLCPR